MTEFDDIRPYNDSEIPGVLKRVIADPECLDLIGSFRFPRHYTKLKWLIRPILRWYLGRQVARVGSVRDFQMLVKRYLTRMIEHTTSGFTVSGLENHDFSQPTLFISNHRDIALDPAFVNYTLNEHGGTTLRIAIGDNLLSKRFASDLMRANKSFIVKRSVNGPRELLQALKTLSAYIWHSLSVDRENVWIAQREGRAKNGIDKTEPAIVKMLTIAKPKQQAFGEYIKSLRIVPVSISYEYDPCDAMKAREMRVLEESGTYEKEAYEDLASIGLGISGHKGKVHLHIGEVLGDGFENADEVALALDNAIIDNYRLHVTNLLAYELLNGKEALLKLNLPAVNDITEEDRKRFNQRIADLPDEDTLFALTMYANPVNSKLARNS